LIIELSHFIDDTTISKILHELFGQIQLKNQGINANQIQIFNIENKEVNLLNSELKESIWRLAGHFNETDKEKLSQLLRVGRGKSTFDKIWLDLDEKSLNDFIDDANVYENREKYLEQWLRRKEKEIENRVNLPPDNLKISDTIIYNRIDSKDKIYRRTLLTNLFKVKSLDEISMKDLSKFVEEFCSSLYAFNFEYPQTVRDIFTALLQDCKNICEEDKQMLQYYRYFFNVETENPFSHLSLQPIKMDSEKSVKNENFEDNLDKYKTAQIPFVKLLVDKMIKTSPINDKI
jgi:hypothetical protein